MKFISRYLSQVFFIALALTLRGSVIAFCGVVLLGNTSLWKFLDSSISAHDTVRQARWSSPPTGSVLAIGIDDVAYRNHFGSRSPLDRRRLAELIDTVASASPSLERLAIDLDLAPAGGQAQEELFQVLSKHSQKIVVAQPQFVTAELDDGIRQWQVRLCKAGISSGYGYLETDFGYVNSSVQPKHSLVSATVDPTQSVCLINPESTGLASDGSRKSLETQKLMMSPRFIRDGMVIPFQGDIGTLRSMIQAVAPRYIVLGGMWGNSDVLKTPFGDRYGLQLHAASIEGAMLGMRSVNPLLAFVSVWFVIATVSLIMGYMQRWVHAVLRFSKVVLPGHVFLEKRVWPVIFLVCCLLLMIGVSEVFAIEFGVTRMAISSAIPLTTLLAFTLFVWYCGTVELRISGDIATAWDMAVKKPMRDEWQSVRACYARIFSSQPGSAGEMSAARNMLELIAAMFSLVLQAVIPVWLLGLLIVGSF